MKTAGMGAGATLLHLRAFGGLAADQPRSARQPVMFIGHGSPMNIIRDNAFTRSLRELGARTEHPAALLVISAHWLTRGQTRVSTHPKPKTIHDFSGFPAELYEVTYPAAGQPELARALIRNVASIQVHDDHEMGLDHGAWSILHHLWPKADIPVFQLSIDYDEPPAFHYALGQELRKLRTQGVMILGSGNIVHNLRLLEGDEDNPRPYPWAQEFDAWARARLLAGDHDALVGYQRQGETARLAVPTNDHYLPMLYTLGLLEKGEAIRFTHESFQNGSISMRCFESA
jgi:4,5-DOPA dioxygenase extradiol